MEYPGSVLTKKLRLSILLVFVGLFFVLTPLILFYTVGYRYDWNSGLLKETGSISIEVAPATTTIYINNQKLDDRSPVRLNTVSPNRYIVRFSLPGYHDWTKEILVRNQQTVYLKDIYLLKNSEPTTMATGTIGSYAVSSDGRSLLYSSTSSGTTRVLLKNLTTNREEIIDRVPAQTRVTLAFAKRNNYFAIITGTAPKLSITIGSSSNPRDVWHVTTPGSPATDWQWRDSLVPELYFSTTSSLFSASPQTNYISTVSANPFPDWRLAGSVLWTMEFSTSTRSWIVHKDTLGFNRVFASISENSLAEVGARAQNVRLAAVYDDTALVSVGSDMFLIVTPTKTFTVRAHTFYVSPHHNWLALYSPFEVTTYQAGEMPAVLSRSGDHLNSLVALDEFNTLAFATNRGVSALFPFYFVNNTLLSSPSSELIADERNRILYGVDRITPAHRLWRLPY